MKLCRFLLSFVAVAALVACSSDGGSGSAPDIPDDPDGTRKVSLSPGGAPLYLDDTGNGVRLDEDGCLYGDNLSFASVGNCDGISYIRYGALSGWRSVKSAVLRKGHGYVMGCKMADGVTFTRIYVDDIDTVTHDVRLKSLSPFFGDGAKFFLNHYSVGDDISKKRELFLYKEAGDTTVVIIRPTTYNVEVVGGEWIRATPLLEFVRLDFSRNNSGAVRTDTLIFSNGKFADVRVPVTQLPVSLNESIF